MILTDSFEFLHHFWKLVQKRRGEVLISTFGIWAGVSGDGRFQEEQAVHQLLTRLEEREHEVKVIVGKPELNECKTDCGYCMDKWKKQIHRIQITALRWPKINWLVTDKVHLKAYLVRSSRGWAGYTGSRNLSDSSWAEAMVRLSAKDAKSLASEFNKIWSKGDCHVLQDASEDKKAE